MSDEIELRFKVHPWKCNVCGEVWVGLRHAHAFHFRIGDAEVDDLADAYADELTE